MNEKRNRNNKRLEYKKRKYAEAKADPETYEIIKNKEKRRYQARKEEGKIQSIADLSLRDQRAKRKKWREAAKKYREKKKQMNMEIPMPETVLIQCEEQSMQTTSAQKQESLDPVNMHSTSSIEHTKIRQIRYKELKKRQRLIAIIQRLKSENLILKKKLQNERKTYEACTIKKAKTKIEEGIRPQEKKTVNQYKLIDLIRQFYNQDDNSTVVAGKNQYKTKNKVRKQKRSLNCSLKELHKKFILKYDLQVSYSFFCKQKPFWIMFPKKDQRETCACVIHSNVELIMECLFKAGIIHEKTTGQLLSVLCCSPNDEICLRRECRLCKERVLKFNEFRNDITLKFFQWTRINETVHTKRGQKSQNVTIKQEKLGTPLEIIQELDRLLPKFFEHCFVIQTQYTNTKTKKDNLSLNEGYIHVDFSENFGLKYAKEVQSMHFGPSRKELSLHTGVIYTYDFQYNETGTTCVCTVSECLRHDAPAIWAHIVPMIQLAFEKNPITDTLHFQSDSPTSQYRNKYMFHIISALSKDFPQIKSITWNYSEAGHGKGAPDGVGAVIKRTADNAIKYGEDVSTFDQFVQVIKTQVENVTVLTVSEQEVIKKENKIPKNLKPFPGTLKVHQVLWQNQVSCLTLRKSSCFSCNAGSVCAHKAHLGFWKIVPDTIAYETISIETTKGQIPHVNSDRRMGSSLKNKGTVGPSNIIIMANKSIVYKKNESQSRIDLLHSSV